MGTRLVRWWQRLGRLRQLALLGGLAVTLLRLSLIGKGSMAFIDEQRYVTAMLGLRALGAGHVREFLQAINSMGARPGEGLWRIIPGLGQAALLLLGKLNPNAPPSLQVPQAFNVLVMSLNAVLLHRIYRRFCSPGFALLGLALYSSLVNTNLYLRHLLPYDHALFFFLLALWLLLSGPRSGARHWWVGLLAGFSYAVYPGYFMGPALLLGLGLLLGLAPGYRAGRLAMLVAIRPLAVQLAGLATVLIVLEALARFADTSYLASSRYIATTVTQGAFGEGLSFVVRYFWEVEGGVGAGLLVLFMAGLGLSIWQAQGADAPSRRAGPHQVALAGLLALGFIAWLGYAVSAQFAHRLVFYGRILHFFGPLLVLGSVVALQHLAGHWRLGKSLLLGGGFLLALWHFGTFVTAYRAVEYPGDVAYQYGIRDARQLAGIDVSSCDDAVIRYRLFGPRIRGEQTAHVPSYRLVNFAYLYPISCFRAPAPTAGRVVAAVPYFMKYIPYQFEGHNARQRALLRAHNYDFRIIRVD